MEEALKKINKRLDNAAKVIKEMQSKQDNIKMELEKLNKKQAETQEQLDVIYNNKEIKKILANLT